MPKSDYSCSMDNGIPIGHIIVRLPDGTTQPLPIEVAEAYKRLMREGHILEALATVNWPRIGGTK